MFKLPCATLATHSSTSPMAKKMLRLEEIETQTVLELPDRQLMRFFDSVRDQVNPRDIVRNLVGFGS